MMNNLFSPFNPSSWTMIQMNWIIIMMIPLIMMNSYWTIQSKMNTLKKKGIMKMMNQFKELMSKSMKMNNMLMMSIMMMILILNTSSMYPYIYAPTAMPQVTVSLALSLWLSIYMKKMSNMMKMLSMMLPKNTPNMLTVPMIMIESISMVIQPITLSVRLMANITAGHILMILMSSAYNLSNMIPTMTAQMILSIMEMCVSFIQAYVFSMLLIMFNK